jgi:glycosyltransferase involved in cell wall biosynthesis
VRRRWLPALARWRPALVHANEAWWAPHAILLGRALRVPVAVHVRDGIHDLRKARAYWLPRADRVIAVSSALRDRLAADPALKSRTAIVFNGHAAPAPAAAGAREECRRAFGLPPDALVVGNAGRLGERKDQRLLLAALGELGRAGDVPGLRALLAGGGDPAYERAVRADVATLGLEDRVVLTGHLPDLGAFFGAIDVLVHCARREGLPRVVPEAMLAGRPVIATPAEGIGDAIPDGAHGLVVPAEPRALAAAIAGLAVDGDLRQRLARAAATRARALFSVEAHRAAMLEVYASLGLAPGSR